MIGNTGNGSPSPDPPPSCAQNVFPFRTTSLIRALRGSKSILLRIERMQMHCRLIGIPDPSKEVRPRTEMPMAQHTDANDPPSPYPMGTPEPHMC